MNKNTVPNEKRSPFVTSGLRIGTPALTTRGMKEDDMKLIASWIDNVLNNIGNSDVIKKTKEDVKTLCEKHPIYS